MITYLYQLLFPNGKRYIGLSNNPNKRWRDHRNNANKKIALPVCYAINKYGWENVKPSIIAVGNRKYIAEMEIAAIELYDTRNNGYNVSFGGEISPSLNPETAKKISFALKGRVPSLQERENMRLAQLGRKHSESTKKKISQSQKGKFVSEETRKKIKESNSGRVHSKQSKLNMSLSHLGFKHSEETKKQIKESNIKTMSKPEFKQKRSEASKKIFLDPVVKEKHRQSVIAAHAKRKAHINQIVI